MADSSSRLSTPGRVPDRGSGPLGPVQTVGGLVDLLAQKLASFEEPRREATDLISALLDVPRHWPLVRANKWLDANVWQRAVVAADKRASGAPLAYAVGRANFRNLTLEIDERALVPRPETELLVDLVLHRCVTGGTAVDVGTGSGAIAIALATEGSFDRVIATDISADALDLARTNAERYSSVLRAPISFAAGNLLDAVGARFVTRAGRVHSEAGRVPQVGESGFVTHGGYPPEAGGAGRMTLVVSNPPYISFAEIAELPASVRDWEPPVALLSSGNGLAITAQLVRQAATRLEPNGLLALEVDVRRASLVAELVSSDTRYEGVSVHLDLAGRERFVLASRRGRGGISE